MTGNYLRFILLYFSAVFNVSRGQDTQIPNPLFHFPGGSDPFQGIIVAIDLPLHPEGFEDLHFSILCEAAYLLPTNETSFEYPPIVAESRKVVYDIVQEKFKSYGYPGKDCLLRAICEAAVYSFQHTGVLGDLLHIILTPSSSINEGLTYKDYKDSEDYGRSNNHCEKYRSMCSFNLLDEISHVSTNLL